MRAVVVFGMSLLLAGCLCNRLEGSGKSARETRSLAGFDALEVSGAFRVHVVVATGPAPRVELEGDDNLLPHVHTTVTGTRLVIDVDTWNYSTRLPLALTVRTTSLRLLQVNGSNTVTAEGIVGDDLVVEANGSATVNLKGQVARLSLDLNGSAEIDALGLTTRVSIVDIAGSGSVSVCATDDLRIDIGGSGDVSYACEPDSIEQDIAGSGRVLKK